MRFCVLIPSDEARQQAGVRIRYERIESHFHREGHSLRIVNISDISSVSDVVDDVYLISKCYDARSYLVTDTIKRAGKKIGIDLFDDYFSQIYDARFTRLRRWLSHIMPQLDYVLCSTPAIARFVKELDSVLPVHLLNDPMDDARVAEVEANLRRKGEARSRENRLQIAWFGMGDNANFPIGLDDLAAFSNELVRLADGNYKVDLTVVTNNRALTAQRLAMLSVFPFPYRCSEWSRETEAECLDSADIAFLPVNAQNFSVAKSLNRAVTALSHGCQVLSVGYPLYEPLSAFIYRTPAELLADLNQEKPRLGGQSLEALRGHLSEIADAQVEAARLLAFLPSLETKVSHAQMLPVSADGNYPAAIIFGFECHPAVFPSAQAAKAITVGSPYAQPKLQYDLKFRWEQHSGRLEVYAADVFLAGLSDDARKLFTLQQMDGIRVYRKFTGDAQLPFDLGWGLISARPDWLDIVLTYQMTMNTVRKFVSHIMPTARQHLAEDSLKPLSYQESGSSDRE